MKIRRFEDLEVWQKSMTLVDRIYELTKKNSFSRDHSLKGQIRRAAISVPSNIAEGFERGSNKEFVQFLYIAKGSAGEVRTQLHIALNQKYITQEEFNPTNDLLTNISVMLKKFINYLSTSTIKGEKFRTVATM